MRAHNRACLPWCICSHTYACVRSRRAGDAPSVDTAATAVITGAVATVTAAAQPLPSPWWRRFRACSQLCLCAPLGPRQRLLAACRARLWGGFSLEAAVCIRGGGWRRPHSNWVIFVSVIGASILPLVSGVDETVEVRGVCSCRLKLCGFLHSTPHRGHIRTLATR